MTSQTKLFSGSGQGLREQDDQGQNKADRLANSATVLARKNDLNLIPEAIQLITEAIGLNPQCAGYYGNRSLCFFKMGDYASSLNDANLALRFEPSSLKYLYRKAMALVHLEKYGDAADTANYMLDLDPQSKQATDLLEQIFGKSEAAVPNVIDTAALQHDDSDVGVVISNLPGSVTADAVLNLVYGCGGISSGISPNVYFINNRDYGDDGSLSVVILLADSKDCEQACYCLNNYPYGIKRLKVELLKRSAYDELSSNGSLGLTASTAILPVESDASSSSSVSQSHLDSDYKAGELYQEKGIDNKRKFSQQGQNNFELQISAASTHDNRQVSPSANEEISWSVDSFASPSHSRGGSPRSPMWTNNQNDSLNSSRSVCWTELPYDATEAASPRSNRSVNEKSPRQKFNTSSAKKSAVTLFPLRVTNVPEDCSSNELKEFISKRLSINDNRSLERYFIVKKPDWDYAFVNFQSINDAELALNALQKSQFNGAILHANMESPTKDIAVMMTTSCSSDNGPVLTQTKTKVNVSIVSDVSLPFHVIFTRIYPLAVKMAGSDVAVYRQKSWNHFYLTLQSAASAAKVAKWLNGFNLDFGTNNGGTLVLLAKAIEGRGRGSSMSKFASGYSFSLDKPSSLIRVDNIDGAVSDEGLTQWFPKTTSFRRDYPVAYFQFNSANFAEKALKQNQGRLLNNTPIIIRYANKI